VNGVLRCFSCITHLSHLLGRTHVLLKLQLDTPIRISPKECDWETSLHWWILAAIGIIVRHRHSAGFPSSISTSPSFCCSSACSTVMYPAGRQMLPLVAFQRRMRPSFPADAKTVLFYDKQRNPKGKRGAPTPWCSTRPWIPQTCCGYVSIELLERTENRTCEGRNPLRHSLTTSALRNFPCAHLQERSDAVSRRAHARHGHPSRRDGMSVHMTVPMKWRLSRMVQSSLRKRIQIQRVEKDRAKEV
jgi:hypothetical protein